MNDINIKYEHAKRDFIDNYDKKLAILKKAEDSFDEYKRDYNSNSTFGTDNIYRIRPVFLDYKMLHSRFEKIYNKLQDSKS